MKKMITIAVFVFLLFLTLTGSAVATMIDNTNTDIVSDDITGLVWYRNISSFKGQTYAQQLDSISSLNSHYDVNEDGHIDTLTWNIASGSTVNDLVSNYQLHNTTNRIEMMDHFSLTRFDSYGNINWHEEIYGNIGSDTTYGTFKLLQTYKYHPTMTTTGYVHDPISYGETIVSGPSPFDPQYSMGLLIFGAWANATVQYGNPVPEPTTIVLFGIGLLGLTGINSRKQQ